MNPLAAFLAAAVFASAARFAGWLSAGGAVAAAAVGGTILVGAGVAGGLLLGVFFVSGSVLSSRSERAALHSLRSSPTERGRAWELWRFPWRRVLEALFSLER
jgi:uncharacterized membrane protein